MEFDRENGHSIGCVFRPNIALIHDTFWHVLSTYLVLDLECLDIDGAVGESTKF